MTKPIFTNGWAVAIALLIKDGYNYANAMAERWTNKEVAGCNADCHDGIPPKTKVLGILPTIL